MNDASRSTKPSILVAPLDWGLGHATRCIPLINRLRTTGCRVTLAGSEKSLVILRSAFPDLPFLPLQGYNIRYAPHRAGMHFSIAAQVPKILRAIRYEKTWLQEINKTHQFDAVISDNRYGLHHPGLHSVIITHQLQIQTGMGAAADRLMRRLHYHMIEKFNACWIPDSAGTPNLAGVLSHPEKLPSVPCSYTGPISRFSKDDEELLPHYILILLSGPEPQRSLLEQKLLTQAAGLKKPVLFVRGLPGHTTLPPVPYHINIVNHLPAPTLQKAIASAQYVVARSGYSTVMDLMILQKKSILIPTPGQTEQEYLARHLMQTRQALCLRQRKFQLAAVLALADSFPYHIPDYSDEQLLGEVVEEMLRDI